MFFVSISKKIHVCVSPALQHSYIRTKTILGTTKQLYIQNHWPQPDTLGFRHYAFIIIFLIVHRNNLEHQKVSQLSKGATTAFQLVLSSAKGFMNSIFCSPGRDDIMDPAWFSYKKHSINSFLQLQLAMLLTVPALHQYTVLMMQVHIQRENKSYESGPTQAEAARHHGKEAETRHCVRIALLSQNLYPQNAATLARQRSRAKERNVQELSPQKWGGIPFTAFKYFRLKNVEVFFTNVHLSIYTLLEILKYNSEIEAYALQ